MDPYSIVELFQSIPFFIWIILLVIIVILFSDKQLWEYEVIFDYHPGVGSGEIEIEYYQKAKGSIDIHLILEENYIHKPLSIYLNQKKIFDIDADSNNKPVLQMHADYTLAEPHEGMLVEIKNDENVILSGKLSID